LTYGVYVHVDFDDDWLGLGLVGVVEGANTAVVVLRVEKPVQELLDGLFVACQLARNGLNVRIEQETGE